MSPALLVISLLLITLIILASLVLVRRRPCDSYPARLKNGLLILDKLYKNVNGMEISLAERERLKTDNPSFTYGEITFPSIATGLAIVEPNQGEIFYDLGAGAGKAVFCAALLNDWKKCRGVEYLPALHECTSALLNQLRQMPEAQHYFPQILDNIEFIQNDIMTADFSDADVIYMNATAFSADQWELLIPKFEALKPGSRIIVLTKRLNNNKFKLVQETMLPMSWGMSSVMVYKRV